MIDASRAQRVSGAQPASRRWAVALLVGGGALSALNGAAHLVLPLLYPWEQHAEGLYEPVRWALFATTVFFAILLVLCGALTVLVARASNLPPQVVTWVAAGMAIFWSVGAAYEVIIPFPAPVADWALPVFSVSVALLYLVGLRLWLRSQPDASSHRSTQG